ncbi:MAG: anhydro-N-acetylmuramic acid kinase [Betaproteobacteria bacterium]|nr:anhydro-N-acetylmuramic acid kinase [Betaproteobacteria bacterium]NDA24379.1 anhydro-N-acetylmuramic acid kinase [Betaproteobacteria bacterium]
MSGTSLDAIDAAWVQFDASGALKVLDFESSPITARLREKLIGLQTDSFGDLELAHRVALEHADESIEVIGRLIDRMRHRQQALRALAIHGQTIRHQPKLGYSLQLLAGAYLAEKTGVDVIGDFRSADIACAGEGAPLVPAFHDAVFSSDAPSAVVNIGGMANISLLIPGKPVGGFDTGPGNVLMDAWISKEHNKPFDAGGGWARQGRIHQNLLAALQMDPYFTRKAPKSTGRDLFNLSWLESRLMHMRGSIPSEDVQRSLLELTAWSISQACQAEAVRKVWVCGGGAGNLLLLERIRSLTQVDVETTAALGIDPQQVEACAFAWLGYRFLHRQPSNLPSVTGARRLKVLGALWPAS